MEKIINELKVMIEDINKKIHEQNTCAQTGNPLAVMRGRQYKWTATEFRLKIDKYEKK